jgi:asparagine synthase (glutamine-hydrolysing)
VTWGDPNSRDVVYSKRLAAHYLLHWHHLELDSSTLVENVVTAVTLGAAEVSPYHYHSMMKLRSLVSQDDCVIASSYGDSVGRAEYSGQHIVTVTLTEINNKRKLFNEILYRENKPIVDNDRSLAWIFDPEQSGIIKNELDMQENYMRRMISHAMNCIRSFTNLRQAFTSEELVSYMFSINPYCRNFDTYFNVLGKLDQFLLEVPWARTGISPSGSLNEVDKDYKKEYHNYDEWFFAEFKGKVTYTLLNGKLLRNNIICVKPVSKLLNDWSKTKSVGQLLSKLYVVELFIQQYNLDVPKLKLSFKDIINKFVYS